MPDDDVIDIQHYLGRTLGDEDPGTFAVWGGGGEHTRFALPLWRAIYLAGGNWGGILSLPRAGAETEPRPLFVLDLKEEPARLACSGGLLRGFGDQRAPATAYSRDEGLAVFLGEDDHRRWYLEVQGGSGLTLPQGKDRETLLFLAGECAGLLFYRELATPFPSSSSTP